jgi:hypothetical protein
MTVTRTIELNDLEPVELAEMFAAMSGQDQARFFGAVWRIAKSWPGAGWCQQSCELVTHLDKDGRDALTTLAAHLDLVPAA